MMRPAALLALLALPAAAQDVVGSAVVDGRKVQLYDDFTWTYDAPFKATCVALAKNLQFCGLDVWHVSNKANPDALASYSADGRHYAQYIIEPLGTKDGLTMDAIRGIVLQVVSTRTGVPATVVETSPVSLGGVAGETLVYAVQVAGIQHVFANTIILGEDFLLQAQTWQVGPLPFSDRHRELHNDFLDATRLTLGNLETP